jgi:holo-[acyl-carrier protein] synthase
MIVGLGIDVVEVDRIRDSLKRFPDRFAGRILTPAEAGYCASCADPATHVAARFAAKEAAGKALGTGLGIELPWHDVEIVRHPSGVPELRLSGKGRALADQRHISRLHLTLAHTAQTAVAVVILEASDKN